MRETTSHYAVLGVSETASVEEIRAAYKKLVLRWHPDKNGNSKVAEEQFKSIGAAYEVLQDVAARGAYDDSRSSRANGHYNPFAPRADSGHHYRPRQHTSFHSAYRTPFNAIPRAKAPDVDVEVWVSLEEVYHGAARKLRVTRKTLQGPTGGPSQERQELLVHVLPGATEGTRYRFREMGDDVPGMIPADVVFVLRHKRHARFEVSGRDLVHTSPLLPADALCGGVLVVPHLDGRPLRVALAPFQVFRGREEEPGCFVLEFIIEGRGMPIPKAGAFDVTHGNLVIRASFQAAASPLTAQQIHALRLQAFGPAALQRVRQQRMLAGAALAVAGTLLLSRVALGRSALRVAGRLVMQLLR